MQFEKILGQEKHIHRFLESVENEHIAHAQHITDNNKGGSFAMALAMASFLLCDKPLQKDSCGICRSCLMVKKMVHPDLHFTFPLIKTKEGEKGNALPIWRNMMLENPYSTYQDWILKGNFQTKKAIIDIKEAASILKDLSLKAFMGKYKILIVWVPESLNIQASNKLLKFIEEPIGKTLILFVGSSFDSILPTIQSRLQQIQLSPYSNEQIESFLLKNKETTAQIAQDISLMSDGDISLAIRWLENAEDITLFSEMFVTWMRLSFQALQKKSLDKLVGWTNETAKLGRNKQIQFLQFASKYIRKSFLTNYQLEELAPFQLKDTQFNIHNFRPFIHAQNCLTIIEEIELAAKHIQQNANAKIVLLDLAFKVARNLHTKLKTESYGM